MKGKRGKKKGRKGIGDSEWIAGKEKRTWRERSGKKR